MKKILSFSILLLQALCNYGQSPQFQWGAVIRSNDETSISATNTPQTIRTNSDGDVFICGTFSSHATGFQRINYNHYDNAGNLSPLASSNGALTTVSVSGNQNLILYKMNRQGQILWQVSSDRGYVDGAYSQMTPTADGGVLLILNVRLVTNNEFEDNRLLRLIGSDNNKTSLSLESFQTNTLQGVAAKINAAGEIQWIRQVIRVDDGLIDGRNATTATYFNDLCTDEDGNYWLAGRYMKSITFNTPDGSTKTFSPHNTEGWNGDAQNSRGDALLVKLDPDGNLLWKLETTGVVEYQAVNSLAYQQNQLFIYGNVAAAANSENASTSFLGYTLYPTDKTNAYSARIDLSAAEPVAVWVKLLKSLPQTNTKGGRIKITSIDYDNGALFVSGSFTGFINVDGENILANDAATGTSTSPLTAFIIRQNPLTGEVLRSVKDPSIGLSAEIRRVAFRQNNIYAFGYTLGTSWIHTYNANFNLSAENNLLSSEGATAWDAHFFNDQLITLNRGRNVTGISGAPSAFISNSPKAYSSFYLSYQLDGLQQTGITASPETFETDISTRPSTIIISGNAEVKIFNFAGTLVYHTFVNGREEINLSAGLYIVTANGKAEKVIVK
jgi:hypothetical protein